MANTFSDQRDILVCFAKAAEEYGDTNVMAFAAKVQTMMGMSVSRKIQALCYLFDNVLMTNAALMTKLNETNEQELPVVTKEDAFTALQMGIAAAAVNYQNGDNK